MFQVSRNSFCKGFFASFCEIMSTTSMHVHTDESRYDVHTFGIDNGCSDYSQIAVCNFQYLSVTNQDGAIFQPSLRSQNMAVYDLR